MRKVTKDDLSNYQKFELISKAFDNYQKNHQWIVKELILDATYQRAAKTTLSFMGIDYIISVEITEDLENEKRMEKDA